MAHNGTAGGIDSPGFTHSHPHVVGYHAVNLNTLLYSQAWTDDTFRASTRVTCIPWFMDKVMPQLSGSRNAAITMPRLPGVAVSKGFLTNWAVKTAVGGSDNAAGSAIYFRNPTALATASQQGMRKGRVVQDSDTGARFYVHSYDTANGDTILQPLSGFFTNSSFNELRDPFDTATGYLYFLETGFYTPCFTLKGDVTAGSAVVTNLSSPDGGAVSGWLTLEVIADDYLFVDPSDPLPPFTGTSAKVASVNPGAATMTMAGNAAADSDQEGRRFELFMRMIA